MLLARGDHRADYTDIEGDYDSISQSVLMNIEAEFDQLIHNVVTRINDILAKAAGQQTGDITLDDGTVLKGANYVFSDPGGYMRMGDGRPIQMFEKVTTDGYRKVNGTISYVDENGVTQTKSGEMWVKNEEIADEADSLYSVKNLRINQKLMQEPAMLGFRLPDGSEDIETAEALKAAFTEEIYTLNPNVRKKTTFVDYYTDLVAQVANSGSVYRSISDNQQTTVEAAESARQQVVGVSSDEELSNMIKFQNAYNASSRYINVISEMLEHIITSLGH